MPRSPQNVTPISRLHGVIDDTGQEVTIETPNPRGKRRRRRGRRPLVTLLDMESMTKLELTGSEYRVLWCIASFIPTKNGIEARCSIAEVAQKLNVAQPFVFRTLKALRERRVIRTVRRGVHEVNPWILYNGDFDSWDDETDHWVEPIWVRGVDTATGEVR